MVMVPTFPPLPFVIHADCETSESVKLYRNNIHYFFHSTNFFPNLFQYIF